MGALLLASPDGEGFSEWLVKTKQPPPRPAPVTSNCAGLGADLQGSVTEPLVSFSGVAGRHTPRKQTLSEVTTGPISET